MKAINLKAKTLIPRYAFSLAVVLIAVAWVWIFFFSGKPEFVSGIGMTEDSPPQKKYCVSQSADQWQLNVNQLNYIASRIRQTELQAKEVSFIIDSLIAPMQRNIISQVSPQVMADSIKTKK